MSVSVVFPRSVRLDPKELKGYIVQNFGKETWQASYSKIQEAVGTMQPSPLGKIPEELGLPNLAQYRQVILGTNRIVYKVRQETTYIHIVCDTRKDMKSLLTQRLLRTI